MELMLKRFVIGRFITKLICMNEVYYIIKILAKLIVYIFKNKYMRGKFGYMAPCMLGNSSGRPICGACMLGNLSGRPICGACMLGNSSGRPVCGPI